MESYSVRQNPYSKTSQKDMRSFIISQNLVTCPFGHLNDYKDNVISLEYNEDYNVWKSLSQDRKFIEDIKIGDVIIIPFKGIKECILARIISEPIYDIYTGLFTNEIDGKIYFSNISGEHFKPVVRKIKIINSNIIFEDKRKYIPMNTLSKISLPDFILEQV